MKKITSGTEPAARVPRLSVKYRGSLIVAWMAASTALGLAEALALPFVREVLHKPESVYGLLGGLLGAGITLGAFLWSLPPLISRCSAVQRFSVAQVLSGCALLAFASGRSLLVCGSAWILGGIGFIGVQVAMTTLLQEEPDARRRAGALGLAHTLEAAGVLVGAILAPSLAGGLGIPVTLGTAGIALAMAAVPVISRRHRRK